MTTDSEDLQAESVDPGAEAAAETPTDAETQPTFDEAERGEQEFKPGDALGHPQANLLCAERETTVVVLAGGHRSGKTSLLAAIYEHLNQQPIADWSFEQSQTLFGFERRCHGARKESGLKIPNIQRSSPLQPPWLHLDLRDVDSDCGVRLLFADISGELFEGLIDGTRDLSELPHVRRADQLSVILDGRKLSDSVEAPVEQARVETLLRHFREEDAVWSPDALSLVVTKLDELLAKDRAAVDYLEEVAQGLSSNAGYSHRLPLFRTAARPKSPELPAGHGVVALFSAWVDAPRAVELHTPQMPTTETAFGRFAVEN